MRLQAQFIAGHGLAGGTVGGEFEPLNDAIFGFARGAIAILIEDRVVPR